MKEIEPAQMKTGPEFDNDSACEVCGRFGAYQFDGIRLCAGCYETRGSCCPEFGGEDQTRRDNSSRAEEASRD